MNHIPTETDSSNVEQGKEQNTLVAGHPSTGNIVVTGIATGVAASVIIQSGKGIMSALAKQPLVMFSLGIATGYLTHKYRKEIISISSKISGQSKDFVLRQKENLKDLCAETREDAEEKES